MNDTINFISSMDMHLLIDAINHLEKVKEVEPTWQKYFIDWFPIFISLGALLITYYWNRNLNRAMLNVVVYSMNNHLYAVASNIGNNDAYNISIRFDGLKDAEPFKYIKIIAKGTSYRAHLMSAERLKDVQKCSCRITYNDRFRKRTCYKSDFDLDLHCINKKNVTYDKDMGIYNIGPL